MPIEYLLVLKAFPLLVPYGIGENTSSHDTLMTVHISIQVCEKYARDSLFELQNPSKFSYIKLNQDFLITVGRIG